MRFDDFQFDPEALLLTRGARRLELSPKALQVLAVLVRNAGSVVSKDELLNSVWAGAAVEEGNLAVHISAIRKALGSGSRYIETAPKRGYRFAAPADPEVERRRIAEFYLQQQTVTGCRRAAAEYRACLGRESGNAKARAGLANTMMLGFVLGDLTSDAALPRAQVLLEEAVRMDPECAGIRMSRARWLCLGEWRWQRAQGELERALALANDDDTRAIAWAWQGCYLVESGQVRSGLAQLRRANAVCPLSPFVARFLAEAHFLARDFSGCVDVSRKALQLHPHSWLLYRALGRALTALGEYGEARRHLRHARLLYDAPQAGLAADLAYLDAAAGDARSARQILGRLEGRAPRVAIAQVYAALGDRERGLEWLERACADRDWSLSAMRQDYRLDPLRGSARYRRVLAKVEI
jgi:DNA-binding winged helix-turn-helix (wHTH) protein